MTGKYKLYYVQFDWEKKSGCEMFIRTFTKAGAVNIIREYYGNTPKDFHCVRLATKADVARLPDRRIMVCSHMMIPWENSYHGKMAEE